MKKRLFGIRNNKNSMEQLLIQILLKSFCRFIEKFLQKMKMTVINLFFFFLENQQKYANHNNIIEEGIIFNFFIKI